MLTTKIETITFSETTIQISEIENSAALNKKICKSAYEIMKKQPNKNLDSLDCNFYTTFMSGQSLTDKEPFSKLKKSILDEVAKYAREQGFDIDRHPLQLNACWLNIYGKGHSHENHRHMSTIRQLLLGHPLNVFSVIYYPKAPKGCGHLVFYSQKNTGLNTPEFRIVPQSGRMVIFRSWLYHSVLPTDTQGDRLSIAFNVSLGGYR